MKIRSFLASFRAAGRGVLDTINHERNMRFHLIAAVFVLYFSRYYELTRAEKSVLILVISLVIGLEFLNTAVETTVDLCCPQLHPLAKRAKDAAAAGVLAAAIGSVFIGIHIFWRPEVLKEIVLSFWTNPLKLFLLIAAIAAGIWFIFFWEEKVIDK